MRKPQFLLAVPAWIWLLVFFVAPVAQVIYFSFGYKPGIFGTHATDQLSFDRYGEALSPTFFTVFRATLWIGVSGTLLCLLIALPVAYWMAAKIPSNRRGLVLALVMVPYWTNFLIRTIGWQVILAPEGFLASILQSIGIIDGPLEILFTRTAVLIGVVYNYLPLMILPLYVAFDRVDPALREASKDLGASKFRTVTRITLPLAKPGIVAGMVLVFIPLMGDYITATVLGGVRGTMVGQLVASQFQNAQNWALGSAMAVILILMTIGTVLVVGMVATIISKLLGRRYRLVLGDAP